VRRPVIAGLLGATSATWSALPLHGTGVLSLVLLAVAGTCVVAGTWRLTARGGTSSLLGRVGWEAIAAVAFIGLEAVHPARPWHSGILAVVLACYLVAVHLAESPWGVRRSRAEAKAVAASLPLIAVSTALAMLPNPADATAGLLDAVAALAAVGATALALAVQR
jgi:hypothetical protein